MKTTVVIDQLSQSIDLINKKDAEVRTKIGFMFLQNKKIADDNRNIFSNIQKGKQEDLNRTKDIFVQLFGLLPQVEIGKDSISTPLYSNYTYETDVTTSNKFRVFKADMVTRDSGSDSFRRVVDIRSLVMKKPQEVFRIVRSEDINNFRKM